LHPAIIIIIHADPRGYQKLRSWGRELGIVVIPIYRDPVVGLPVSNDFKKRMAWDLFSSDPFDFTGPVISDTDFFGRRNEALELVRHLEQGKIKALFGIRKSGKTSIINRSVQEARNQGILRLSMIDCSLNDFFSLNYNDALGIVATTIDLAVSDKYASNTDAVKIGPTDINLVFSSLAEKLSSDTLAIVFDEVDYITPGSPTSQHWKQDFNHFWRTLRVHLQEAQRRGIKISLLVSGVSSLWFKEETINSVENAALHFIPEEYLNPFPRAASKAMIRELGKRCGLIFNDATADLLAKECADFPFWIRKAASIFHKSIPVENRPYEISFDDVKSILSQFIEGEGGEVVGVALRHLSRAHPKCFIALSKINSGQVVSKSELYTLERYGLIHRNQGNIAIACQLISEGLTRALELAEQQRLDALLVQDENEIKSKLSLEIDEWAEELGAVSKRRNVLERKLREFIYFGIKFTPDKNVSVVDRILAALSSERRKELSGINADEVLKKLNFRELIQIIEKHWVIFEKQFGDKKEFKLNTIVVNDRPDAHAKDYDKLDFARYRESLEWLENHIKG
jgi:hypothetical protein